MNFKIVALLEYVCALTSHGFFLFICLCRCDNLIKLFTHLIRERINITSTGVKTTVYCVMRPLDQKVCKAMSYGQGNVVRRVTSMLRE